jgi:DNA polymerase-3 subunit alpha
MSCGLYIRTEASSDSSMMKATISLLKYFSGNTPVCFCSAGNTGNVVKRDIEEYRVEICETLLNELIERFGSENVKVVAKK